MLRSGDFDIKLLDCMVSASLVYHRWEFPIYRNNLNSDLKNLNSLMNFSDYLILSVFIYAYILSIFLR